MHRGQLADRSKRVLKWVVREYVDSGTPVAASHLVNMDKFSVRGATLRNELNRLSQEGLLFQPHTSAGRIPSELGYRYFVHNLMETQIPGEDVQRNYVREIQQFAQDLDLLIQSTSHFLGDMAQALVLISMPQEVATRIESVALHEVDHDTILLIINLSLAQVKTLTLRLDTRISRTMLRETENILNDRFAGMPIEEFNNRTRTETYDNRQDSVLYKAVKQLELALAGNESAEYLYYGSHQLLHYPEFQAASQLEPLLEALENRHLGRVLPPPSSEAHPSILVGSEIGNDIIAGMSVVSIRYQGENCEGAIHILGPTRMAYERIAGLATFTSSVIGKKLKETFNR